MTNVDGQVREDTSRSRSVSRVPLYRVKTYRGKIVWEDSIDARTGNVLDSSSGTSLTDLSKEDRHIIGGFQTLRQDLLDAVLVAERKAISAGVIAENARLNFIIVVVSGQDLRQVILKPPTKNEERPSRAGRHSTR